MAEKRARDTKPERAASIPEPTQDALSFRGESVTPWRIVEVCRNGMQAKQKSRARILKVRSMRRMEVSSLVRLPPKWRKLHPEAAAWARTVLPERIGLERDLIAKVGAVEPEFVIEPLGFNETDGDRAEEQESYLEEWRRQSCPTQAFAGKSVEDGEFARITMPTDLDLDGCPDYFEYIGERAYESLDDTQQSSYQQDAGDRRGRYVKVDAEGSKQVTVAYRARPLTADEKKLPLDEREKVQARLDRESEQAHAKDVAQYILACNLKASSTRIIPALDCAPIFKRGQGNERWELAALVERVLYEPWELIEDTRNVRWRGLGDRLLVPQGYRDDGTVYDIPESDRGVNGQVYVYTIYYTSKDGDGHVHPMIASTVGGHGSWDAGSGTEDDPTSVTVIDLYDEYGIEGQAGTLQPFVSYHGGLHTEDDDPDHYWQPYLWALYALIQSLEGQMTATRAATAVNAYTGYIYTPDGRLAEAAPESVVDTGGNLIRPEIPAPGEIKPAAGSVLPFQQAQVGVDAWRLQDQDRVALAQATAIDQQQGGPDASGHALLVQATIGQVAKRHNREGVLAAVVKSGEAHLRILDAIYQKYQIRWPIRTVQERPISNAETREANDILQYDPAWVANGQFNLKAEYPEEENIARISLEADLADRGYGNSDRVLASMGEKNPKLARLKAARDRLMKRPEVDAVVLQRVAQQLNDRDMLDIQEMQSQQQMSKASVPGAGPVPMAARNGPGQQQQGALAGAPGGGSTADSVRGGIVGAAMTGDRMQQAAQSALTGAA